MLLGDSRSTNTVQQQPPPPLQQTSLISHSSNEKKLEITSKQHEESPSDSSSASFILGPAVSDSPTATATTTPTATPPLLSIPIPIPLLHIAGIYNSDQEIPQERLVPNTLSPTTTTTTTPPSSSPLFCIAIHPYLAARTDELSFAPGTLLRIARKVLGGWWEGVVLGNSSASSQTATTTTTTSSDFCGWFPANHVHPFPNTHNQVIAAGQEALLHVTAQDLEYYRRRLILFNNHLLDIHYPPLYHYQLDLLVVHSPPPQISLSSSSHNQHQRATLIYKLISNDIEFVNQLRAFLLEFVYPLAHASDWFPKQDYQELFGTFEGVFKFHLNLSSRLQHSISSFSSSDGGIGDISECMLSMIDLLEVVYTLHAAQIPRAIEISMNYSNNSKMNKFLNATSASSVPNNGPLILYIISFLHKPIERKYFYSAILSKILEFTDPVTDPHNHILLQQACDKILHAIESIETCKRLHENKRIIRNLSRRLDHWPITTSSTAASTTTTTSATDDLHQMTWEPSLENYGNLLLHGHMKLAVGGMGISKTSGNIIEGATTAVFLINSSSSSSSSSEVAKEREFFLLDRILVIVRTTRSVFRKEYGSRGAIIHKLVDRVAIVAGLVVTEIFDDSNLSFEIAVPLSSEAANNKMALNVSPSSYRFLTVFASNSEQRIAWLTALRSAIAAVSVRPSSVPPPPTPPPPTLPSSFSSVTPPPSNLSTIEDMFESIDNERQHQGLLHVSDLQTSRISACKTVEIAGLEGGGGGGGEDGWKWLSSDALSIHAEIKNYGSPTTSPSVSPRSSLVSSDLKEHYEQQHINFNRLHHYTPQFYRHNNNMQMSFPASKSNILEWRSAASSSSPPLLLNQEERNELLRFQSLPTSLKSRASSSSNSGDGDEQRDNDQEVEREVEEEEEDILSPYPTNDFGNRRATGTTDWDLNLSSSPKKQQQPYPPPTSMARSTSSRKSTATANASLSSSSSLGRSRRDNSDGGEVSRGGTVMSSSSSSSSASTSTRRNRLSSKKSVSNLKEAFKGSMKKMFLRKSKSIHTLKAGYDNNIGLGADNDDGALVHLTPSSSSPPSSGYRVGEYRMVMDDNDEGVSTLATGTSNTLPRASPKQGINYFESWEVKTAASAAIKSDSLLPPFTTARESISHMSTASGAPSKTFAVVDDRASSTDSHLLRQQHQNSSSFDKIDDNSNCKNNNASDSASNYVLDFYLKEKSFESDCEELLKSFSGDFGSTKTLSGNVASTIPEIITPPKASAATNITSSTLAVAANMTDADLESNPVQALEQLLQADRSSSTPSDPQSVRSKLSVYGKNAVSGLIDDYFQ